MGVFDIKSNGLVIANNGETKLINKHCFNNKKARFVNVEIPPTKLTYRISALPALSPMSAYALFIQARPIESTDDNDFVGLLGVITEFSYEYVYMGYYNNSDKRKYLSEYGVVNKDTENETFYTNGEVIQTEDISSFPENPSNTVLYRIIEKGEKHYYRYYSDSNLFVRVYFSTDILDLTFIPSMYYRPGDIYQGRFNGFSHNSAGSIDKDFNDDEYPSTTKSEFDSGCIPSVIVSNNIKENIEFSSEYEKVCSNILMAKQDTAASEIPLDNEQYVIIPSLEYKDNRYQVTGELYYVKKDYNVLAKVNPTRIYSSPSRVYGGPLLIYNQNTEDERYFTMFPDIKNTDNLETYLNEEHNSNYSFIYFKPYVNQNDIYNIALSSTRWDYTIETQIGFSFGKLHKAYHYILSFDITELIGENIEYMYLRIESNDYWAQRPNSKIIRNINKGDHIECKFTFRTISVTSIAVCNMYIASSSGVSVTKLTAENITLKCINPEHDIKMDISGSSIFPMIIKEVPNDELSELYFCQSEESASKEGYPTTYIGQPMLNKRMAFNVPYSVAFLNSKVPGHFPYTTYNIWSGKRYINIALPQTEYDISQDTEPIISARRLANSTTESYTEIIAKVYPGSYAVDPTTKTVKTSGTIRTVRLYNLTVYESYTNVTLTPYYQNDEILYWYYRMYGEYDPEQMGDEGSIELRLYNNIDRLDNKNTLCMVCNFDIYTYFDLIGLELINFNIKAELVDAEGDGIVTATGLVSNPIYDVTAEEDEQEIPYHYSYSSSTKKLHIDWKNNAINYPISTYGSLTVNENYIGPYLIVKSKYMTFNFTEDETLNNIINPNPNVIDYDGPHTLTVNARPRSFERITDYFAGNISFLYSREAYRVLTRTISFSRTMDFDTSKPLCLTFKQFNIYHIDGSKTLSFDLHYQLQYNDVYRGWYIIFDDEPIDPDDEEWTPGFIRMVITNTGITITLDDYNSQGVYYTAWSIEITGGLSLYQEED